MSGRLGAACALGLLLCGAAAAAAPLEERLDRALSHPALRGARIAALVVRGEDGGVLYARDPDRELVPASNLKLLTALATLSVFGPAHRFATDVYADAPPDAEGGVRHLYVRGGGDPTLTSEEMWRLAADLRRAGLRTVREAIVLDASLFDGERWHPSWGKVSARAYNAPVSALMVNYGAFAVQVRAGDAPGESVRASLDPPVSFLRLSNRARTVSPRSRGEPILERRSAGQFEDVLLSGDVRAGSEATYYRSVLDPVLYAGSVLELQLQANGVAVSGALQRGSVPEQAVPLLHFEGQPVAEVVRLFMKYSNNVIGESLVKALAAHAGVVPASWSAGIDAMRTELGGLGLPLDRLEFVDGSGLSYANHVAPRAFVAALLVAHRSFRFGPEFVSALPIGGVDGTLAERAEGAADAVRAKTGNLTRVTGLSGYARLPSGDVAIFSLLVNGYRSSTQAAWDGVDGFVDALVAGEPARLAQELRPSP